MFTRCLPVLFFMICTSVQAQVKDAIIPDHARVAVKYIFENVTDTTQRNEITTDNMILFIGEKSSVYKSYDRMMRDSALKEQFEKMQRAGAANAGGITINASGLKPGSPTSFYKYPSEEKLSRVEPFIKNYVIEESLPVINWAITQETKNIQDLSCQKATATFRGRHYTAWFTTQIPYSNGPWKLGGLPGLIVEAADDKNEVVFRFSGFEDVSNQHITITLPENAIKATDKEYRQLREAAAANPSGVIGGADGSGMKVVAGRSLGGAPVKRKVNNNPIELTDK